jgi:flavin reductase (DIM6/NTAB) family NADH-FMN oxidoreductase RutF
MARLSLTSEAFREAASRYASGVVVVTTQSDGFDHAMTATSFTTVSLDPMLVLVCVEQETRFHDALCPDGPIGLDPAGHAWAVSVLAATEQPAAGWFATKGRPLHGQFGRFAHSRGEVTGNILLDNALAAMEVRTISSQPFGDHTVVIGQVLSLHVSNDQVDEESERKSDWPLAYWARRYRNFEH